MTQKPDNSTNNLIQFPSMKLKAFSATEVDEGILRSLGKMIDEIPKPEAERQLELNKHDLLCLEDEKHFKARFGFALGKRGRLAILDFVDQYDLTNAEVKSLHNISAFKWNGQKLTVKLHNWVGILGIFFLFIPLFYIALVIWAIMATSTEAWQNRLMLFLFLSVFTFFAGWIFRALINPFLMFWRRSKVN